MILDDGTDTDKVMIRAVSKGTFPDVIMSLTAYAQPIVPKTNTRSLMEYWNGPDGNKQWTYSIVDPDPESCKQMILGICASQEELIV
jgi:hypothetical protein